MARREDLERAARRATPGQLNAMLNSPDDDVARAAADEVRRRSEERPGSLTGVVRPIDQT